MNDTRTRTAFAAFLALLLPALASAQAGPSEESPDEAAGRPKWEAGVAGGAGRVTDYPGSDQAHVRGIAAPLLIYRGKVLRVDQGGIRGRLMNSPDWEFDVAATAAFNARNNDARQGMPGLDYIFGAGPQLIYRGWQHQGGGPSLHLKLRALMSTDFHRFDTRGAAFDPELRWRFRPLAGSPAMLTLSMQPTWATRALHSYFYQVDPAYATATRPAYQAHGGYLGTDFGVGVGARYSSSLSWFVSTHAMSLQGSANAASPLLRDKSNLSVGAGIVWTPWHSAARAGD
jgi:outer membrane scaffolding protein for murein synthesis (MipA/OmpV family)